MSFQEIAQASQPLLLGAVGGGILSAAAVGLTWWLDRRASAVNALLKDAMSVLSLREAWLLEGTQGGDAYREATLSDHAAAPLVDSGHPVWLRRVELRAVLDEHEWNAPTEPFFRFIENARTWVVRNKVTGKLSYPLSTDSAIHQPHPAAISSRAVQELCAWAERVANFKKCYRVSSRLGDRDLRMLRPLLLALACPDRVRVLRAALTTEAARFLEWYAKRYRDKGVA
jgi:hypothetical protein